MLEEDRLLRDAKTGLDRSIPEQAIHRRCLECAYDPLLPGNKYEQIRDCLAPHCSLFPYRIQADDRAMVLEIVNPKDSRNWQRKQALIREHQEKSTPRDAIAAYCIDCSFAAAEPGNWREQIRKCHIKRCDLWMVRPK
jgi:hypothetical protein